MTEPISGFRLKPENGTFFASTLIWTASCSFVKTQGMSIISFIESIYKDRDLLQSKVSELRQVEGIAVEFYDGKSILPFLSKKPWIRIYGIEDLLEKEDGSEEKYWNFSPTGARKLTDFLSNFFEVYQKSFLFSFIWAGNEIGATVKNVNLTQLLTIIRSNKLEEAIYKVEVNPC